MSSTKNPDHEAENPASMPEGQLEKKPAGHKAKMAPLAHAAPGRRTTRCRENLVALLLSSSSTQLRARVPAAAGRRALA